MSEFDSWPGRRPSITLEQYTRLRKIFKQRRALAIELQQICAEAKISKSHCYAYVSRGVRRYDVARR
jgi:hypothetical protein